MGSQFTTRTFKAPGALAVAKAAEPSSRATAAVIKGFTRMLPEAIASKASGYSPAMAQEPTTSSSRVTTTCKGKGTWGERFPHQNDPAAFSYGADREIDRRCRTHDFHGNVHFQVRKIPPTQEHFIGPEFAGQLQPAFVQIHRDHMPRAGALQCLDDEQADETGTYHEHRPPGHPARPRHRMQGDAHRLREGRFFK